MKIALLALLVLLNIQWSIETQDGETSGTTPPNLLPEGYDKAKRPHFGTAVPDVCNFTVIVYKLGPVSEASMTMTTDIYLRQQWSDPRLEWTASQYIQAGYNDRNFVSLGKLDAERIWKPRIYFKDSISEFTPDEVSESQFMRLYEGGILKSSQRVLLETRCDITLDFFPMDVQDCDICFESYQYDDSEQLIQWGLNTSSLMTESTATFFLNQTAIHWAETTHWDALDADYTTLCMKVRLTRKLTMYIVTMYLPSMALVVLSWVSFWIDKKAVPARAGLTITTILAQITLITGTANRFPGIADLKLGDIYMIVNFFFVFGSLIEFAMISSASAAAKASRPRKSSVDKQDLPVDCRRRRSLVRRLLPKNTDDWSKIVFPVTFTLWNAAYFSFAFSRRDLHH